MSRIGLLIVALAAISIGAVTYAGSKLLGNNPYLDETDPSRDAVITVGDPLLYARESLINDRRNEYDYLAKLLAASEDPASVRFTPQLVRDLSMLSAANVQMSGQLRGHSDPAPPAQPNQADAQTSKDAATKPAPAKEPLIASPQDEFRDRQAYRAELRAALAAVNLDDLHDLGGNALFRLQFKIASFPGKIKNKFGIARITVLPPSLESSEIASIYRIWLGHMSSRLNYFDAQGKLVGDAQYGNSGIAPRFAKITRLGVTSIPIPDGGKDACLATNPEDIRSISRTAGTDCHVLSLAVAPSAISAFKLFDGVDEILLRASEQLVSSEGFESVCRDRVTREQWPIALEWAVKVLQASPSLEAALDGVVAGSDQVDRGRVSTGGQADNLLDLRTQYQRLGAAAANARSYLSTVTVAAENVLAVWNQVKSSAGSCIERRNLPSSTAEVVKALVPPLDFATALVNSSNLAKGQAYAYGTSPVELAQRLSTNASTAASLEVALALAAKSGSDVAVQGGADYARSAAQTAAALERIPLVIGFSDRRRDAVSENGELDGKRKKSGEAGKQSASKVEDQSALKSLTTRAPQFGWVLGPKVRFDPYEQRFLFEQAVSSFDVAADVSVPSWWPRAELRIETAWVGNWHNANDVLKDAPRSTRSISVPLPVNRADLDGLTKFLVRDSIWRSTELTNIHFVEPNVISACAEEVTFLIYGANIWRSAEVYLGGTRADQVKVLPDMEGISARFKLSDFYKTTNQSSNPLGYEEVVLRVNTRNGKDWRPIRIIGSRSSAKKDNESSNTCVAPYSVPSPIVRHQWTPIPTIFALAPDVLEHCADSSQVIITGRNLVSSVIDEQSQPVRRMPRVMLNGVVGSAEAVNQSDDPSALQVLAMSFPKPQAPVSDNVSHQLIIVNQGGFASANIPAKRCVQATNVSEQLTKQDVVRPKDEFTAAPNK